MMMVTTVRTYPLRDLVRRARGLAGPDVPLPAAALPADIPIRLPEQPIQP
jgi:hypothetical protein